MRVFRCVQDRTVGTIKLYYRRGIEIDRTGYRRGRSFSPPQLSSYELEAELTARAEVKALRAQISAFLVQHAQHHCISYTRTNLSKRHTDFFVSSLCFIAIPWKLRVASFPFSELAQVTIEARFGKRIWHMSMRM